MKKTISLFLALVLCLSLCACGGGDDTDTTPPSEALHEAPSEAETVVYAEDKLSFELVGYEAWPSAYTVNIDFKFRNITEEDFGRVTFAVQALDNNGDIIETDHMGEDNLGAGQAAWFTFQTNDSRSSQTIEDLSGKVAYLKVVSVQIALDPMDTSTYSDLVFKEPIIITVADVQDKETASSTGNAPEAEEVMQSEEVSNLLLSSDWHRKDENNATIAIMTFAEDNTGLLEVIDSDSYNFTWNVDTNNTIHVILMVDDREAPGTYTLLEEDGVYAIQLTDNVSFTYYAE